MSGPIENGSSPLNRVVWSGVTTVARLDPVDRLGDLGDVRGRRSAAAADDVDQAGLGELAEHPGGLGRRLVVPAEGVRQAGIRVRGDVGVGEPGQVGDVRAHLGRTERAVHADDERLGVLDRAPERLDGLPGQRPAGQVDDGHRDPQRQLGSDLAGGGDRGLAVQGVEDGLDQQQVDATLLERGDLLGVRVLHLLERHRPVRRVLDPRRQGQRDVQRADRAGDELAAELVGRLAGEPGTFDVHVADQRLQAVVGLADAGRGEGVRGGDVGAGRQVLPVDVQDHVRPHQVQQVGVTGDVVGVVEEPVALVVLGGQLRALQHRAPRAVQDRHPLVQQVAKFGLTFRHRGYLQKSLRRRPSSVLPQTERGGTLRPVAAPLDLGAHLTDRDGSEQNPCPRAETASIGNETP